MIEMVAFDVAGTTVTDDGLVIKAFEKAFALTVPEIWAVKSQDLTKYALDTMGQSKIEVFTAMLGDANLAEQANRSFEAAYLELVQTEGVSEIQGARLVLEDLKSRGIKTALTTGFSRPTINAIIDSLDWQGLVQVTVVPGDVGAGRPSPLMLEAAASFLSVEHASNCVVLGDTVSDMEAAVKFGAGMRVGVLSGAHSSAALAAAGAINIIDSVASLPNLLFNSRL